MSEFQLRRSDNGKFYYLVQFDKDMNEDILVEGTLDECRAHEAVKGLKLEPIDEKDTRGTVQPNPEAPTRWPK